MRRAGCYLYEPLLRAGVRIYEFQPTLIHQRVVIVDGIWSHVGSSNFDSRSLKLARTSASDCSIATWRHN